MTRPGTVQGRERLRLFCALRLPDAVLDALVEWGGEHLAERIVSRANLHITLAFLGHRPRDELDAIVAATRDAAAAGAGGLHSVRRRRLPFGAAVLGGAVRSRRIVRPRRLS